MEIALAFLGGMRILQTKVGPEKHGLLTPFLEGSMLDEGIVSKITPGLDASVGFPISVCVGRLH